MNQIEKVVEALLTYNNKCIINEVKNNSERVINTQILLDSILLVEINKNNECTIHDAFIKDFLGKAGIKIDEFIEIHRFNEYYNNLINNKLQSSFEPSGLATYDVDKVYNVYTNMLIKGDSINSLRFITDNMPIIKKDNETYKKEYIKKSFIIFDTAGAKYAVEINSAIANNKILSFNVLSAIMKEFNNGGAFGLQELLESPSSIDGFDKMFGDVALS